MRFCSLLAILIGLSFSSVASSSETSWPNSSENFWLDVSRGRVTGVSVVHKFGRNPALVAAAGFETVWSGLGLYTGHNATAAEIVEVFSDQAADTGAGTGARTVRLFGLDGARASITEVVILDGVTPVDTVNSYLRLDRIKVLTAGSGGENEGDITARQSVTTANVFAIVTATYNQTMITAFTVPADKTAYLDGWICSMNGTLAADLTCRITWREPGSVFQVKEEFLLQLTGDPVERRHYRIPKNSIPPGTDIRVDVDTTMSNVAASAAMDIILVDNNIGD